MKTIYKYPVPVTDRPTILLPDAAEILTVQVQDGNIMLWAVADPEKPIHNRRLWLYGTGHPMWGTEGRYIATVQTGKLVWHIFDEATV